MKVDHDVARLEPVWGITLDEFLGRHVVSEAFAVDGRDGGYDHVFSWEPEAEVLWADGKGYEIRALPDFDPPTVVLRHGARTGGFYMGGELWLDHRDRGKGLAPEMVLACVARFGELPFRRPSGMGFSEKGLRAHAMAHKGAILHALDEGVDLPEEVRDEFRASVRDWVAGFGP